MTNPENFVTTYFTEEKIESLFFIIIGFISIVLAIVFLFIVKYSFFKGLAYPLLIVGFIQLTVGSIVSVRSQKDIIKVQQMIKQEPQKIQAQELPRMEIVMKNFTTYKWIEIIFISIGFLLFIYFRSSPQTFWKGLGLGLLMQGGLLLSLDIIAEKRAQTYVEQLQKNTY